MWGPLPPTFLLSLSRCIGHPFLLSLGSVRQPDVWTVLMDVGTGAWEDCAVCGQHCLPQPKAKAVRRGRALACPLHEAHRWCWMRRVTAVGKENELYSPQSRHERSWADGPGGEGGLNMGNRICTLLFLCRVFSRCVVSTYCGLALGVMENKSDVAFSGIGFLVRA